jgi:hypothetical protein
LGFPLAEGRDVEGSGHLHLPSRRKIGKGKAHLLRQIGGSVDHAYGNLRGLPLLDAGFLGNTELEDRLGTKGNLGHAGRRRGRLQGHRLREKFGNRFAKGIGLEVAEANDPLFVQKVGRGDLVNPPKVGEGVIPALSLEGDGPRNPVGGDDAPQILGAFVKAYPHDFEALGMELPVKFQKPGEAGHAWRAPCGPKIEEYNLSAEARKGKVFSGSEFPEGEVGSRRARD